MAAGRGGGCCFPAGLLLLLLLWALLASLAPLAADKSVTHRYENVKMVEISVHPANEEEESATMEISSVSAPRSPDDAEISAETEEETLNNLVNLLQDVVKNIPTDLVPTTVQPPTIEVHEGGSSSSVTMDTVWVNVKPHHGESMATDLAEEITSATTPFWKLRSDETVTVVLRSDSTSEGLTPLGGHQTETSESVVLFSEESTPETRVATVSLTEREEEAPMVEETKRFNHLTNGALSSLVESLKNMKKLHLSLNTLNHHPEHDLPLQNPSGVNILESIDTLIETIKNAPSTVKDDPSLHDYIEESEGYLKNALELAGQAEKKLLWRKEQEVLHEMEHHLPTLVAPAETEMQVGIELPGHLDTVHEEPTKLDIEMPVSLTSVTPESELKLEVEDALSSTETPHIHEEDTLETELHHHLLHKKAEEAQVEMGKLKAFINLLYGFSPQLTEYAEHSPHGNVAENILDKSMDVIEAIKSVFCGNSNRKSKQILKHLLKKDMALVREAMKERKAS